MRNRNKPRPGPKSKKRKNGTGRHFGLAYLGFIGRCSAFLGSLVVQAALLCPSFELARRTLQFSVIDLNVKTIHRITMALAQEAMPKQGRISLVIVNKEC